MKKIITVLLLISVILMSGCKTAEKPAEESVETKTPIPIETPPTPPEPVVTAPAVEEQPMETVTPVATETEYTHRDGMVNSVSCVDGKAIRFTLTNIEDDLWTISSDVMFYLNNVLDKTPECTKETLSPGETTICTLDSASLGFSPSIIVQSPLNKDVRKVSCE